MKITVEGTPEELSQAFPNLMRSAAMPSDARADAPPEAPADAPWPTLKHRPDVTVDFARKVLTRRPLSPEQRLVLVTLYEAFPSWVAIADLQAKVKYKPSQFTGLMGAFGRRIATTAGLVTGSRFFVQEWDPKAKAQRYSLAGSVAEAMRLEKLV